MTTYEYKVVPAPKKGKRGNGAKGADGRFANALMELMNQHGAEGWEYQRSDTLPCEARSGLTGKAKVFQNMLIFRRVIEPAASAALEPAPVPVARIAEVHAPVLPSPEEANALPDRAAGPDGTEAEKRDLAAE